MLELITEHAPVGFQLELISLSIRFCKLVTEPLYLSISAIEPLEAVGFIGVVHRESIVPRRYPLCSCGRREESVYMISMKAIHAAPHHSV